MRVKHHPQLIKQINFNVDFANEETLRNMFLNHYRLYSYLYMCVEDNIAIIQDVADLNRDYYNEIYKTMLLEYNPLDNYDMTEDERTDNDIQSSASNNNTNVQTPTDWKTTTSNSGYEVSGTAADTETVENTGTFTTTDSASNSATTNADITRHLTRRGNIGVMSSQDLIQKSRDITLKLVSMYLDEFKNCFNLEF